MSGAPETIRVTSEPGGHLVGFIAIDTTINGRARGGLRMLPDVSQDELEKLARAMTLKYGFLGLPQGGAKAGIIGDPEAPPEQRGAALLQFARAAKLLLDRRTYVPDADMGTSGPEIQRMLDAVGVRVARREYRGSRSGDYTAGTVFEAARAAAAVARLDLHGCRVAVEGFGKVGGPLAEMFVRAGGRVVAVSTRAGGLYDADGLDVARLRARVRAAGDAAVVDGCRGQRMAADEVKEVPADIFCPCARHDTIGVQDVPRMAATVISCGANHPVTPEAERLLWERGVLCVPDFVANCGGVLGGTMEFAGWRPEEIFGFYDRRFRDRVALLIRSAQRSGQALRDLAEASSLDRFAEMKLQAERRSWRGRGVQAALAAYREGLLPARLVRWLSAAYFEHRLA